MADGTWTSSLYIKWQCVDRINGSALAHLVDSFANTLVITSILYLYLYTMHTWVYMYTLILLRDGSRSYNTIINFSRICTQQQTKSNTYTLVYIQLSQWKESNWCSYLMPVYVSFVINIIIIIIVMIGIYIILVVYFVSERWKKNRMKKVVCYCRQNQTRSMFCLNIQHLRIMCLFCILLYPSSGLHTWQTATTIEYGKIAGWCLN